jgi:hypothetical protein
MTRRIKVKDRTTGTILVTQKEEASDEGRPGTNNFTQGQKVNCKLIGESMKVLLLYRVNSLKHLLTVDQW